VSLNIFHLRTSDINTVAKTNTNSSLENTKVLKSDYLTLAQVSGLSLSDLSLPLCSVIFAVDFPVHGESLPAHFSLILLLRSRKHATISSGYDDDHSPLCHLLFDGLR
jgi:hypothetical protein